MKVRGEAAQTGVDTRRATESPGGIPPYTVALIGFLPEGLNLVPSETITPNSNFGRYSIYGVPTAAGNYSFQLRFCDSSGLVVDQNYSMHVSGLTSITTSIPAGIRRHAAMDEPFRGRLVKRYAGNGDRLSLPVAG
jgi:hypothetical protein